MLNGFPTNLQKLFKRGKMAFSTNGAEAIRHPQVKKMNLNHKPKLTLQESRTSM